MPDDRMLTSYADPVDLSGSTKIPWMMELVEELSRATTPQQVIGAFRRGIRRETETHGFVSISTRELPRGSYRVTRLNVGENQGEAIDRADPWSKRESLPVHDDGLVAALIADPMPKVLHNLRVKNDPALGGELAEIRSLLAMPLFEGGEVRNWALILSREPNGFSQAEVESSLVEGNLVGGTVGRVQLARELNAWKDAAQREIDRIAAIQAGLLPKELPEIPGATLGARLDTYDSAGGDHYHFRPMRWTDPEDAAREVDGWMLTVADASGHGPAAAVVAAMVHAVLSCLDERTEGPADVLTRLNRTLAASQVESSFVTAFVGLYDPVKRTLLHSSAGHPPPLVRSTGSEARTLARFGGIPLGIIEDTEFEEGATQLASGDTLVLYSDGIVEAMSPEHDMFGLDGIATAVRECSGYAECSIDSILRDVRAFERGTRPTDDQTLVVMRIT